ncbi:Sodium channel subunit beta-1 [Bagarius yarrelli]|uniref:Sodium channel regulatory subunit beta-3 n=1 Tax=Bagarius yarrelli TaxID=175774 RepID=A0A556VW02_BAGYA|nr:Sodium channel subunit beta-1 [Bagarius yarrelli]
MTAVQVFRLPLLLLLLCVLQVRLSSSACVEVDSDTEAVVGKEFKLGCISCKMRGEVEATATVDWWFMAEGETDFTHIYSYSNKVGMVTDDRFSGRIEWLGSKDTLDLQDGTLNILNVTYNDTGTYRCYFDRTLTFTYYEFHTNIKNITISVLAKAWRCDGSCAEVDSMTEAVVGQEFLLNCISCKKREEVPGAATVDWHFKPVGEDEFLHIFHYEFPISSILHERFESRLEWGGTKGTADLQIGAINILNVTFNDTGTYTCTFERTLFLQLQNEYVTIKKTVELIVLAEANRELTAVISEIMMYIVIVVLQLWLIGVLVYCYRKIYAENEAREARKAQRAKKK